MRNFLQYFYSLIFVALIGCSSADQYSKEIIKVDKLVSNTLETNNLPGLSLTIVKDGNKIYSKGFGYADIDKQIQVLPSKTKFRIGLIELLIEISNVRGKKFNKNLTKDFITETLILPVNQFQVIHKYI